MKTKFTSANVVKFVLIMGLFSTIFSCIKDLPIGGGGNPGGSKPAFNLNVILTSPTKGSRGSGFLEFRQDPDTNRIIDLDTRVSHLEPNHAYILERAVNPIADSTGCSSTTWLKLGLGLVPQSIHTDAFGNGEADLWRNVTSAARGAAFHIHFQVIDSASSTPVLISDCYNYAIR